MSNGGYMDKAEIVKGSGQSGKALELTIDQLNPGEKAVLSCLQTAGTKLKIRQIVEINGWDNPSITKGNSRVRNALRRLVRSGMVIHSKQIGDGTYQASGTVANPMARNPRPVTDHEVEEMQEDYAVSDGIKRTDCAFYNACLDQAISGKWQGFACTSCNAYAEPDSFQKEMDQVRLSAVRMAVELVEKYGKVHRVRGVKPGADAKRTVRLKVVDTVSLSEALALTD